MTPAKQKQTGKRSNSGTAPRRSSKQPPAPAPVLDAESRHEVIGIVLCALAVALGLMVLTQSPALVPKLVSDALRMGFGVGAYVIPVVVLLWAVTFFVRAVRVDETRVGIGLTLLLVSGISIASVGAPTAMRFEPAVLISHGGYLGGGIAWGLTTLFGGSISYVILSAIALIGLVFAACPSPSSSIGSRMPYAVRDRACGCRGPPAASRSEDDAHRGVRETGA